MKKFINKAVTVVVAMVILCGMFGMATMASATKPIKVSSGGVDYEIVPYLDSQKVKTCYISKLGKNVKRKLIIPNRVKDKEGNFYKVIYISITNKYESGGKSSDKIRCVILPSSIKFVDPSMFKGLKNLKTVRVNKNNPYLSIKNGVFFNKNKTKLVSFLNFASCKKSYTVPETVTAIDNFAFYGCENLTRIRIPESVKSIGHEAFYGCNKLTDLVLPETVETMGRGVFLGCKSLKRIAIPEIIEIIEEEMFYGCDSLEEVILPDYVESIGEKAFWGCKSLKSVYMPENLKSIEGEMFYGCESLSNIEIPDGVESIEENAFLGCKSLRNVNIPSNVKSIGKNAFADCLELKSVTLPISISYIGIDVFDGCKNIESIYIPAGTKNFYEKELERDWDNGKGIIHKLIEK